ncbi:meiosis-specific nuclear structural protein 1 [Drosophila nasuta]|uniref:meiosis-specific nuclear structural protein 1 n=1 Tax=Drosophila nasuta TaxID=42062 RepID=UPI00295E8396|nr:meiosis-specific nuclear structural protein 1 [Drosophila nasuta]
METTVKALSNVRDQAPAIVITGRPKLSVSVDADLVYKNEKFFGTLMNETRLLDSVLSKENPQRQQAAQFETAMSDELKKLKQQQFVDRTRRQQLRNDCEELRILAEQLRLAAITKELDEHIVERHRNRQLAKDAKVKGNERAEAQRLQKLAQEQERELLKKQEQIRFRESLSSQIEQTQLRRKHQCVKTAAEREESIVIQRRIEEEDKAEQLQMLRIKQKNLQCHLEHMKQKHEYKEREKALSAEMAAKLEQEQAQRAQQKDEIEAARRAAQLKQEQISLKIGKQVQEIENVKRQRDNLLLDLLQAEYKAKDDERHRQQLEQEQLERLRARQELERYRACMRERSLEDARLRQQQIVERTQETVESQEIEEIAKERTRRREHGALLLSMIEENNRKRAEAAAENVQFFDMKAKSEAELQHRIEEERLKMLSSVPAEVLQYLPKHALSQADRKRFNIRSKTEILQ